MNTVMKLATISSFLILSACGGSSSDSSSTTTATPPVNSDGQPAATVTYELKFTQTWSAANFPTNYPSNAHFSPVVGLTHNAQGTIFKMDTTATPGIVSMAETGSKSALKSEISDIQNQGNSDYLIDESGISNGGTSVSMTFEASQSFPLLSVVSMVAPSPDWFVGLESLPLFENGQWVESKTVQLKVYDAGSDSGTRFASGDLATSPAGTVKLLSSARSDSDFSEGIHFETGNHIGFIEIKLMQ